MREAVVYENNTYHCDVRSAESLDKIYETRRDWLKDNLGAVEGLEEINEEDWEMKLND